LNEDNLQSKIKKWMVDLKKKNVDLEKIHIEMMDIINLYLRKDKNLKSQIKKILKEGDWEEELILNVIFAKIGEKSAIEKISNVIGHVRIIKEPVINEYKNFYNLICMNQQKGLSRLKGACNYLEFRVLVHEAAENFKKKILNIEELIDYVFKIKKLYQDSDSYYKSLLKKYVNNKTLENENDVLFYSAKFEVDKILLYIALTLIGDKSGVKYLEELFLNELLFMNTILINTGKILKYFMKEAEYAKEFSELLKILEINQIFNEISLYYDSLENEVLEEKINKLIKMHRSNDKCLKKFIKKYCDLEYLKDTSPFLSPSERIKKVINILYLLISYFDGNKKALNKLINLMSEGSFKFFDSLEEKVITRLIGFIQNKKVINRLAKILISDRNKSNYFFRIMALRSIGLMNDEVIAGILLIYALKDKIPEVQKEAAIILEKKGWNINNILLKYLKYIQNINKFQQFGTLFPQYNEFEHVNLDNESCEVINMISLGKINEFLEKYSDSSIILKVCKNFFGFIPVNALKILGKIGDDNAIKALVEVLNDDNDEIVEVAIKALGEINDSRIFKPLHELLTKTPSSDSKAYEIIKILLKMADPYIINNLSFYGKILLKEERSLEGLTLLFSQDLPLDENTLKTLEKPIWKIIQEYSKSNKLFDVIKNLKSVNLLKIFLYYLSKFHLNEDFEEFISELIKIMIENLIKIKPQETFNVLSSSIRRYYASYDSFFIIAKLLNKLSSYPDILKIAIETFLKYTEDTSIRTYDLEDIIKKHPDIGIKAIKSINKYNKRYDCLCYLSLIEPSADVLLDIIDYWYEYPYPIIRWKRGEVGRWEGVDMYYNRIKDIISLCKKNLGYNIEKIGIKLIWFIVYAVVFEAFVHGGLDMQMSEQGIEKLCKVQNPLTTYCLVKITEIKPITLFHFYSARGDEYGYALEKYKGDIPEDDFIEMNKNRYDEFSDVFKYLVDFSEQRNLAYKELKRRGINTSNKLELRKKALEYIQNLLS